MKKYLRHLNPTKLRCSGATIKKIEQIHGVPMKEVYGNMENPDKLVKVVPQEARGKHDEIFALFFEKTTRKQIKIVILYKKLIDRVYITTAHEYDIREQKKVKIVKKHRK